MAAPKHSEFPPGHRIAGRYRLDHPLGQGGMGAVYAALDEELSRQVAIKLLLSAHAGNRQVVERFEREARTAATIQHPGVVEIYGRGADAGILYLVMERLRGESLDARIARTPQLPLPFVARVGVDLCAALGAAHDKGVIHRDLKPSNVFLADVGDFIDVVKVLDFGVAKLREGPQLTGSKQVFGTLAYMPPEQLQSAAAAVPASDLYAIGCILFEMVTGQRPFDAVGQAALTISILEDRPRSISQFRGGVSPALCAVIERALHKKPTQRFASAYEMGDALYAIAEELGETAPRRRRPQSSAPPAPYLAAEGSSPADPTLPFGGSSKPPRLAFETTAPPPRDAPGEPEGEAVNAWNVAEADRAQAKQGPEELDSHVRKRGRNGRLVGVALGLVALVFAGITLALVAMD